MCSLHQTWGCLTLNKMLLNTAMRRLMRRMLATSRYMDMTVGVSHRPGWHGIWPSPPQSGSMSPANTSPYNIK
ncbi:hypothetical protein E2C01_035547 [Portunus trituberculatus]|uniref:Uncharacterized protein n=1 Tax=Portunus trituberculatus TaxID=210409 RepID=A0A5B7F8R6_PORTR|nr:hypothetical protein [Portunus trituberculatus]